MRARLRVLPFIVLASVVIASVGGWQLSHGYAEARTDADLISDSVRLETELRNRMAAYEQVLHGAAGLFVSSEEVTRDEWRHYFEALDLDARFPGFLGLGYAAYLQPSELLAHEAEIRSEGFENYTVHPTTPRDEYTSIVYLEPFDVRNQRAFGYDMFSEEVRREAMNRARDTGEAALSGRVTLVQENGTDPQHGFLLYLAVYTPGMPLDSVEDRRAALRGWVYSPFRAGDFVNGMDAFRDEHVRLAIYDGVGADPDHLLYESPSPPRGSHERIVTLDFAGQPWTVLEQPTAAGVSAYRYLPPVVLFGGLVIGALLFGISHVLVQTHSRATAIAQGMTSELRARTRELESSNQALRQFNYVVTHDLKEPLRGIDVYLKVLDEDFRDRLDPEARSILGRARAASARLANLLGALLELSRTEREQLRLAAVDPMAVLDSEQCRASYETLARERGARIETHDAPAVLAAPSVLAQALGNLVGNAIRHNASAQPRVIVRGRRVGEAVELSVEDNGNGFPEPLLAAFDAGRLDARGFGLLLARQSAERLGGQLRLGRSAELGGAAVTLILPAAAPGPSAPRTEAAGHPRTLGSSSASR